MYISAWEPTNHEHQAHTGTKLMRLLRTIALVIAAPFSAISCSTPVQMFMLSNDGEFIDYAGTATISGFYFVNPSNIEIHDAVCFFPDDSSQKSLPQDSDGNPFHWMCFSNNAEAREMLGLDSLQHSDSACYQGYAKITVESYRRYVAESEGVSFSELTNTHQHSAASVVSCNAIHSP
ncbi:hypothetical protein [Luteimonas sp. A501]